MRKSLIPALLLLTIAPSLNFTRAQNSTATPTFYRDILPILQSHCQSCHRPNQIAPMPFLTYKQTKPYAQAIASAIRDHKMPPWFADSTIGHFSNDPSLTETEISTLITWANASAPAGNPSEAPPQKQWTSGWQIPTPDKIITMPTAVKLPATGDIDYTYEIVPTHFTEDRWIQSSEIRPSAPANVHHAVVYIRPPNSNWLKHAPLNTPFTGADMTDTQDRRDTHFTTADILLVYAPGSSPDAWPAGDAKLVPANSDLVLQMHYISHAHGSTTSQNRSTNHSHTTTRTHASSDQTSIGLIFAKTPPAQRILTLQLTNDRFVIPPGVPDFRVEVHGSLPNDATLLSFFPHMHLRGKTFEYNLISSAKDSLRPRPAVSSDQPAAVSSAQSTEGAPGSQLVHEPGSSSNSTTARSNAPLSPRNNSTSTPLLRVNYDFYWQLSYRLAQPLPLKAGDILQAVATFDNSKNNPHNPDPSVAVRWGDQTQDEMMVGFFDVAVPATIDKQHFFLRFNSPGEN